MSYWFAENAQTQQPRKCHQATERIIPNNDASLYNATTRKLAILQQQRDNIALTQPILGQHAQTVRRTFKPLSNIVNKSQAESNRHYDMQQQQKQALYKQTQALFYSKLDSSAARSLAQRDTMQRDHQYAALVTALRQKRNVALKELYTAEAKMYSNELAARGLTLIPT